jgi:hypothetical protein
LTRTRDAENQQLALELRELRVPLLQRLPRRLASGALSLERRPGVDKSGPLLLELPLSPLAGGTLLQEPVLRDGERSNLGVERSNLTRALSSAWLCWACASRSHARTSWFSARTVVTSASQLVAKVRILSTSPRARCSASSRSMRAVQIRSRAEGRAGACLSLSWSWSCRATARYDSQLFGDLRASASAEKASPCS